MSSRFPHRAAARLRVLAELRPGATRRKAREALALATRADSLAHVLVDVLAADGRAELGATYTDPVVARVQARKRRIEASGLQLIQGGAL